MTTMTEAQFQRRITDLADWLGLRWFHSGDSRRDSCAGFPDLVIVGNCVIYAEVKTDKGRMSGDQWEWHKHLTDAGAEMHIWRPAAWNAIETRLRELAKPKGDQ